MERRGTKRSFRKKSILVSELEGEVIDGYYVEYSDEDGAVDFADGIAVHFEAEIGDMPEISPTEDDIATWDRILYEMYDCGITRVTDRGVGYEVFVSADSSGLDYWFSEGDYFSFTVYVQFVENYELSVEDLAQVIDDLESVIMETLQVAHALEDISVVDKVFRRA